MTGRSYNELVGLGNAHRQQRVAALKLLTDGVDCCPYTDICGGQPMYRSVDSARLHGMPSWLGQLDLDDWPGRIFGGPQVKRLAHRKCNRIRGAQLGNRLRALGIKRSISKPRATRRRVQARRTRWG